MQRQGLSEVIITQDQKVRGAKRRGQPPLRSDEACAGTLNVAFSLASTVMLPCPIQRDVQRLLAPRIQVELGLLLPTFQRDALSIYPVRNAVITNTTSAIQRCFVRNQSIFRSEGFPE